MLIPIPRSQPRRLLVVGLLQAGASLYGVATIAMLVALAVTQASGRTFVQTFTVLLFVIGSVLVVDGVLGCRTCIDRSWRCTRNGAFARLIGLGKLATGLCALALTGIGVCV